MSAEACSTLRVRDRIARERQVLSRGHRTPISSPPFKARGGGIAGAPSRFGHGPLGTIDDSNSNVMVDNASKGPRYWMDEIAFLEDRLNGGQGEIDHDDRAACEEALKAAQANLKASQQ